MKRENLSQGTFTYLSKWQDRQISLLIWSAPRMFMKTLLGMLCVRTLATGAFAQGLVVFNNTPSTPVSQFIPPAGARTVISGPAGSFYFGLLTSPNDGPATTFTFSGNYATNSGTDGQFIGGTQAVNGWAPGKAMFYEVVGWSANLGPTFQPSWLTGIGISPGDFLGVSMAASGVAGGGTPPTSPFALFGSAGINSGFALSTPILVPEPSSMGLMVFGVAVFFICRRKSGPNRHMQPDPAIASLFHAERPRRGAADLQRYAPSE